MDVKILNQPVSLHISTISLVNNTSSDVNLFRCPACGGAVAQYKGAVVKIYPNMEPTVDAVVIDKCRQCGELYTFQTHLYKNQATKVTLYFNPYGPLTQNFFCFICRKPLIKYDLKHIVDNSQSPMIKEIKLPYFLKCSNPVCPASYEFKELL